MNTIDIANGMIFKKLNIQKETFEDRLICQKKIYLFQSLGSNLGYSYNWYVRGPYSPTLTSYLYDNLDVLINADFSKYKLTTVADEHATCVNGLLAEKPSGFSEASWYELLASLTYISRNKKSWSIKDKKDLIESLIKHKPQYDKEQCEKALEILVDRGFCEVGDLND